MLFIFSFDLWFYCLVPKFHLKLNNPQAYQDKYKKLDDTKKKNVNAITDSLLYSVAASQIP